MKKYLMITSAIEITIVVVVPLIYFYILKPIGIAKDTGTILLLIGFKASAIDFAMFVKQSF